MGFSSKQVGALRRGLQRHHIRNREVQGRTLSYIEGWHAIAEANRIFGFDGWDRETVETKPLTSRENRGTFHAAYLAKVRITVRAENRLVVREGYGSGEAYGSALGETHERALKTAETDATKRALATFGRPFGLELYVSTRPASEAAKPLPINDADRRRTQQRLGPDGRYRVHTRAPIPLDPSGSHTTLTEPTSIATDPRPNESATDPKLLEGERVLATSSPPPTAPPLQPAESAPLDPLTESEQSGATESVGNLLIEWPKRRREPDHLRYVQSQPCLLCARAPSDAHHLRFAQPRGLGRKVSDEFTVPLCRVHHRQLHGSGKETAWWESVLPDVDPLAIAQALWEESRRKISAPQPAAE